MAEFFFETVLAALPLRVLLFVVGVLFVVAGVYFRVAN